MAFQVGVFIGSLSSKSINRKLANTIFRLAKGSNLELTEIPIRDLPLYNHDFDGKYPPEGAALKRAIESMDAIIFVTPEYNRSIPGSLKNAIDWAYKPFNKKAVAYVAYGSVGGARAVEHLRTIMVELQAVSVRHGVHVGGSDFMPVMMGQKTWDDILPGQAAFAKDLLDNLAWWTNATKAAREGDQVAAKAA